MNVQQTATAAKGPLVWLDMDQKALDDAYDQMVYAPNRDQVHKRNVFNSERVRQRLGAPKRIAYGPGENEKLDLFAAKQPNAPVNVFIHGGAWRLRWAKDYAFLAEMFVRAGRLVGLDSSGRLRRGDLCRWPTRCRAVAWVCQNAKSSAAIQTAFTSRRSRRGARQRRDHRPEDLWRRTTS